MRITKKYAGSSCIGKQVFQPYQGSIYGEELALLLHQSDQELRDLEQRFMIKLHSKGIPVVMPRNSLQLAPNYALEQFSTQNEAPNMEKCTHELERKLNSTPWQQDVAHQGIGKAKLARVASHHNAVEEDGPQALEGSAEPTASRCIGAISVGQYLNQHISSFSSVPLSSVDCKDFYGVLNSNAPLASAAAPISGGAECGITNSPSEALTTGEEYLQRFHAHLLKQHEGKKEVKEEKEEKKRKIMMMVMKCEEEEEEKEDAVLGSVHFSSKRPKRKRDQPPSLFGGAQQLSAAKAFSTTVRSRQLRLRDSKRTRSAPNLTTLELDFIKGSGEHSASRTKATDHTTYALSAADTRQTSSPPTMPTSPTIVSTGAAGLCGEEEGRGKRTGNVYNFLQCYSPNLNAAAAATSAPPAALGKAGVQCRKWPASSGRAPVHDRGHARRGLGLGLQRSRSVMALMEFEKLAADDHAAGAG